MRNGRLAVSLPFAVMTVALPVLTGKTAFLLFGLAALIHEGGHLLALWLLGGRVERVCLRLSGADLRCRGRLSYGGECLLALAGPTANLLCACLCAALARLWSQPVLYRFIGCHLVLALFNLLPALPLDGGRVLQALLELHWPLRGEAAARVVSLIVGLLLAVLGLVLLGESGNPTLLAAGVVILLKSDAKTLYTSQKNW